ncbi:YbaB/EbfC family nucleoid-associated protein [Actinomadura rupiterrae]|uniref:YbaB/EbfC family nucleoid-associated protein n=1 Tax=Actinomadura rupiterrae TaxID=559627 RepID=UPI0020A398F2|nr:YbaB/EbfC family nucleoid-associated protein [Actinomadura rupiterrae]MCP2337346.1 DNA-binding protein YbaB [Actinomadura rupiterrae]
MSRSDPPTSLENLLNSSTPYAPRDVDDVRERISTYQPTPDTQETTQQRHASEPRGDDSEGKEGLIPEEPHSGTRPIELSEITQSYQYAEMFNSPSRTSGLSEEFIERLEAEMAARERRRFRAASPDGLVAAEVDGNGQLIALKISDDIFRKVDSQRIGSKIVDVVTAATIHSAKKSSAEH